MPKKVHFDDTVGSFRVIVIQTPNGGVRVQAFDADDDHPVSELKLVSSGKDLSDAEATSAKLLSPIDFDTILSTVAEHYELPISAIRGKRRQPRIAEARHVAMWLAKNLTPMTLKELAKAFGKSDHTTIAHGSKRVENQMKKDKDFKYRVNFLSQKIKKDSDG